MEGNELHKKIFTDTESSTEQSAWDSTYEHMVTVGMKAMEKQSAFYRWASQEWWYADNVDRWVNCDDTKRENPINEAELYELYKKENP